MDNECVLNLISNVPYHSLGLLVLHKANAIKRVIYQLKQLIASLPVNSNV